MQESLKKVFLGCVNSPPRPEAGSRNLGQAFLRCFVCSVTLRADYVAYWLSSAFLTKIDRRTKLLILILSSSDNRVKSSQYFSPFPAMTD